MTPNALFSSLNALSPAPAHTVDQARGRLKQHALTAGVDETVFLGRFGNRRDFKRVHQPWAHRLFDRQPDLGLASI